MSKRKLARRYAQAAKREMAPMNNPRFRFALQRHLATGEYPADEKLANLIKNWRVLQVVEATIRPEVNTEADVAARLPFDPSDEDFQTGAAWAAEIAAAAR
jgi:hypothetical protein